MNNKRKGFSIAELLIALLIISIVLSAAIPTITKKNTAGSEKIWRWAGRNNSAYFGVGQNQSAIIGAQELPELDTYFYLEDGEEIPENVRFTTDGDKLALFKRNESNNTESKNFQNSHIAFYTIDGDTENNIHYAGRIALDRHNMAIGIGSLQNINPIEMSDSDSAFKGYNTAIGHYSLFNNREGIQNTAIGERALIWNNDGNGNTAVGYQSLAGSSQGGGSPSNSTAIGNFALQHNFGKNNTAVGANALNENEGEGNTAVGANACNNLMGDYNICIGYNAGVTTKEDTETASQEDSYAFYLGTKSSEDENIAEAALLSGHTSKEATARIKDLLVNVDNFQIRTQDSGGSIFNVTTGSTNSYINGKFSFIFRDPRTTGSVASVLTLQERCGTGTLDKDVCSGNAGNILFMTSDIGKSFRNISFNDVLRIVFPVNAGDTTQTVKLNISDSVLLDKSGTVKANLLELNNNVLIDREAKFKLNVTNNDGFLLRSLVDASSPFDVIKAQGTALTISAKENLTIDGGTNYINVYNNAGLKLAKQGQQAAVTLNSDGLIQADSLILTQLSSHSQGNLKFIIDDIYQRLNTASDIRLKNISGDNTAGLKEITALEVKNYTYKSDKNKTPHVGVIAQQLQKVFPNSVLKGDDGYLRITKDEMFYALINSVKELLAKIQDLTAKITGLDKRITELEKQNQQLKKQNAEFEKRLSKLEKKVK